MRIPKRNFILNVIAGGFSKLADEIGSPKLVLPWVLSAIGAPTFFVGLLVPIRRAGALIPQMFVASWTKNIARRKWIWVGGALGQMVAMALIALATYTSSGFWGGLLIVLFLALFSVARSFGSLSFKDVLAKTIPKTDRSNVLGARAAIGGVYAVAFGLSLKYVLADGSGPEVYALLMLGAAGLWLLSALTFSAISEEKSAIAKKSTLIDDFKTSVYIVKKDQTFRKFLFVRTLVEVIKLSIPFFALLLRDVSGGSIANLGLFLVATSVAAAIGSPVLGMIGSRSSRLLLGISFALAALAGFVGVGVGLYGWLSGSVYLLSLILLGIGLADVGTKIGGDTYLVNAAEEENRPLYVAINNTFVGVLVVLGVLFSVLAAATSIEMTIAVFGMLGLAGVFAVTLLPEDAKGTFSLDT